LREKNYRGGPKEKVIGRSQLRLPPKSFPKIYLEGCGLPLPSEGRVTKPHPKGIEILLTERELSKKVGGRGPRGKRYGSLSVETAGEGRDFFTFFSGVVCTKTAREIIGGAAGTGVSVANVDVSCVGNAIETDWSRNLWGIGDGEWKGEPLVRRGMGAYTCRGRFLYLIKEKRGMWDSLKSIRGGIKKRPPDGTRFNVRKRTSQP